MTGSDKDTILRFRASERHLHWAIAVPFMVSWATAVVLVLVYNPHPERPLRFVFSWVHRASGVWLSVLPLWTAFVHRRDIGAYLENIREAWRWDRDDFSWLLLMGPSAMNSRVRLPDQGKFNAAEKINFLSVMCTYPLYIITGLLIWLPGVALLAWLLHFSLAVMATPLLIGHIFMATVNPDTRVGLSGMLTGLVPREWARHHYRKWYMEKFERETVPQPIAVVTLLANAPGSEAVEQPAADRRDQVLSERPAEADRMPPAGRTAPAAGIVATVQ